MELFALDPVMLISWPGGMEWLWIVIIAILLFGGRKIPELARGIGKGIREFNTARNGIKEEIEAGLSEEENPSEARQSKGKIKEKTV